MIEFSQLIILFAIAVAGTLAFRRFRQMDMELFNAVHLTVFIGYFGLVGARTIFWLVTPNDRIRGPIYSVLDPMGGGIVSWGGLLRRLFSDSAVEPD